MKSLLSIALCLALLTDWVSPSQARGEAAAAESSCAWVPEPAPEQVSESMCAPAEGPDCNGNGVEDAVDIASGYSVDLDGNGVPDECDARRR